MLFVYGMMAANNILLQWLCFNDFILFTARRNARIASVVLATGVRTAIPSVRLSACLSVTRRYCVKTTARSTVQFALSDSKVSSFVETKKYSPGTTPSTWNLGWNWLTPPDSNESWHVLPCSALTVRASEKSSTMANRNSIRAFQRAINQGSTPPLTSSKWGSNT